MDAGIIEHDDRWFGQLEGQRVELLAHENGVDRTGGGGPMRRVVAAKEPPAVEPKPFLGGDTDVFARKLPAIRHVSFATDVGFIAI